MSNTSYDNNQEEQILLESYTQEIYDRPSLTVDIVALSVIDVPSQNYRKPAIKKMAILLVKRLEHPYKHRWALPGGYLRKNETLEEAASREFSEETGNDNISMTQLKVFSAPNRDPRGWVVSTAFLATVKQENLKTLAGGDALDASWFEIDFQILNQEQSSIQRYSIVLTNGIDILSTTFDLLGTLGNIENATIKIIKSDMFSFDHNQIIAYAILFLKSRVNETNHIYNMLNELFTLTDLQKTHEAITGETNIISNFRRKMKPFLEKTDQSRGEIACRPAILYKKKSYKTQIEVAVNEYSNRS